MTRFAERATRLAGRGLDLADALTARAATAAVRCGASARAHVVGIGTAALVALLPIGGGYLAVGAAGIDPLRGGYVVRVRLADSGGLLARQDVTFRGVRVGTVRAVEVTATGVVAVAEIDDGVRIPADGAVAVARLSAAGEQYLDFRPDTEAPPFLREGSVVEADRTSTPVTINEFLVDTGALVSGLNPRRLDAIIGELDRALADGPGQLRAVIAGLSQATAGLTALLPQTLGLLEHLRVIAATTAHAQPDLATLVRGSGAVFTAFGDADAEIRGLLTTGPARLRTLEGVVTETADPVTALVTDLGAVLRSSRLRTEALRALFPAVVTGTAAMGIPLHDNAFYTLMDIWPRPTCEYETIPVAPSTVTDGRVRLYNYCVTSDPGLQVRGSAAAPRPAGAGAATAPPPGADPDALSDPLPPN
ncbi:MlaD family protein [Nocardia thailandica]|uniref:MlaD family protein n=1 Tax=Nocardia thailandica TaxID=257275 RepID=A0ABW6PV80_9NOCA